MPASALTATDMLLKRNAELSKDLGAKSFTLTPDLHALVLTCADHRVDPAFGSVERRSIWPIFRHSPA